MTEMIGLLSLPRHNYKFTKSNPKHDQRINLSKNDRSTSPLSFKHYLEILHLA